MKFIEQRDVPIASIRVGPRLRQLDEAWVDALAGMIATEGQQEPIGVHLVGANGYGLTFGEHRLAAVQRNGKKTIRADVFETETDKPGLEIRLYEIMENVGRRELSALDRAANLAELKRIHEELYPGTKRGVAGGKARQKSATDILSFAESVAEKTGLSPRHIRRAVALHGAIAAPIRQALAALPIADNASELRALSKLAPDLQSRVAKLIESGKARKVSAALAVIDGKAAKPNPDHAAFEALLKAWHRAGAKARRRFLREIGATEASGT